MRSVHFEWTCCCWARAQRGAEGIRWTAGLEGRPLATKCVGQGRYVCSSSSLHANGRIRLGRSVNMCLELVQLGSIASLACQAAGSLPAHTDVQLLGLLRALKTATPCALRTDTTLYLTVLPISAQCRSHRLRFRLLTHYCVGGSTATPATQPSRSWSHADCTARKNLDRVEE